ncbi:Hypothetical protein ORPV_99 [Orpheovirus IHUMI-LCC2]|uniref:Uncharacterized protein n=1 Tax=Orpheovirus IHUMI-LCC2 TaxID=2023057 RepID=A0A2I2L3A1_9VIRU|nr:Hypothetical protein ORPV_99 [Orpheovirus IHUMI-LCC2]SNW62003.1 Hypothetical protein ORPV_99 [Orpheovirus IHUMI-LCC2]
MIRVGTITYKGGKKIPKIEGFTTIEVLTKSSKYGELGPYVLKNENAMIMENIWQFGKIYKKVPRSIQRYSQYDKTIIWDWPEEEHIDGNGNILPAYWNWRYKGMMCDNAVRYPVGKPHTSSCIGYLQYQADNNGNIICSRLLNYIEARKEVYYKVYVDLVRREKKYEELRERLNKGENLLIVEVDGPREESMSYYKEKYGVNDNWIQNNTILVNEENMKILLNDPRHAFGHGYCLAMSLLNMQPS